MAAASDVQPRFTIVGDSQVKHFDTCVKRPDEFPASYAGRVGVPREWRIPTNFGCGAHLEFLGRGGAHIANLSEWSFDLHHQGLCPSVVFIMSGGNDVIYYSALDAARALVAQAESLQLACKRDSHVRMTQVAIAGITPRSEVVDATAKPVWDTRIGKFRAPNAGHNKWAAVVNYNLSTLVSGRENVHFVQMPESLRLCRGKNKYDHFGSSRSGEPLLRGDGTHLSYSGYHLIWENTRDKLMEFHNLSMSKRTR